MATHKNTIGEGDVHGAHIMIGVRRAVDEADNDVHEPGDGRGSEAPTPCGVITGHAPTDASERSLHTRTIPFVTLYDDVEVARSNARLAEQHPRRRPDHDEPAALRCKPRKDQPRVHRVSVARPVPSPRTNRLWRVKTFLAGMRSGLRTRRSDRSPESEFIAEREASRGVAT